MTKQNRLAAIEKVVSVQIKKEGWLLNFLKTLSDEDKLIFLVTVLELLGGKGATDLPPGYMRRFIELYAQRIKKTTH